MPAYEPMDCDLHDYLEIACRYRYRLRIELTDGSEIEAAALTTHTEPSKVEFLNVRAADGVRDIRLDALHAITPRDAAAKFGRVVLRP